MIRLPASTQIPIFKIIKHMEYTYSSKNISYIIKFIIINFIDCIFEREIFFHFNFMNFNRAYHDIVVSHPVGLKSIYYSLPLSFSLFFINIYTYMTSAINFDNFPFLILWDQFLTCGTNFEPLGLKFMHYSYHDSKMM